MTQQCWHGALVLRYRMQMSQISKRSVMDVSRCQCMANLPVPGSKSDRDGWAQPYEPTETASNAFLKKLIGWTKMLDTNLLRITTVIFAHKLLTFRQQLLPSSEWLLPTRRLQGLQQFVVDMTQLVGALISVHDAFALLTNLDESWQPPWSTMYFCQTHGRWPLPLSSW